MGKIYEFQQKKIEYQIAYEKVMVKTAVWLIKSSRWTRHASTTHRMGLPSVEKTIV
ncbi:hypothetical protein DESC_310080 [Desulfosarcina cetonica]|nr:hypothetical protein DESC_310080 [Desulfosarcina cetonica]